MHRIYLVLLGSLMVGLAFLVAYTSLPATFSEASSAHMVVGLMCMFMSWVGSLIFGWNITAIIMGETHIR